MPPKGKYTDPKLRDKVKEDVQNSDKGGAPGQWSARKAQLMASEYKKQGGDYTTDKETGQDESQKNLSKWGEEDWQTKDGSGTAKHEDGTRERYLPKKAWDQMNDEEKEETDQKKQDASAKGQQHVANTGKAKQARSNANKETAEKDEKEDEEKDEGKTAKQAKSKDSKDMKQKKAKDGKQTDGSAPRRSGRGAKQDAGDKPKAAAKEQADENDAEEDEDDAEEQQQKPGQKRSRQINKGDDNDDSSNKKQKSNNGAAKSKNGETFGSKHDSTDEPAPAASADRLPEKGQRVSWKALPGWVHGETVEVLTKEKTVDGKKVKASEKDPRIVMKSDNGKIAVHKPSAVHF